MFFPVLQKLKIREAMKAGVITVNVEAPVGEAINLLSANDVSGIVVVDEFGETWGVISAIDIITSLMGKTIEEINELTAEDVMTPQAIEIDPEKTLEDAAKIMGEKRIHRLVIGHPHEGRRVPVGLISATDILKALEREIS